MILTTCSNTNEAEKLARILLTERLAACVNIFSNVKSLYWWKNEIQEEQEVFLFIKTAKDLEKKLMDKIKTIHSYDVPAIYAIDSTTEIDDAYLAWINKETKNSHS